jgi:hypothetical protein
MAHYYGNEKKMHHTFWKKATFSRVQTSVARTTFFKDEEEDDAKEMEEIKPSASSMPTVRGRSKTMPASVMPLFNSHF